MTMKPDDMTELECLEKAADHYKAALEIAKAEIERLRAGLHTQKNQTEIWFSRAQAHQSGADAKEKRIAELEAELQLRNDELRAIRCTIVATVGGVDYEGFPTSEINWLQRLRILLEKEKQLKKQQELQQENKLG